LNDALYGFQNNVISKLSEKSQIAEIQRLELKGQNTNFGCKKTSFNTSST